MNEKIVIIVQKMCENVMRIVEMEKKKMQRIVQIVRRMFEYVVKHVEMER
jgi:hypothetical protein